MEMLQHWMFGVLPPHNIRRDHFPTSAQTYSKSNNDKKNNDFSHSRFVPYVEQRQKNSLDYKTVGKCACSQRLKIRVLKLNRKRWLDAIKMHVMHTNNLKSIKLFRFFVCIKLKKKLRPQLTLWLSLTTLKHYLFFLNMKKLKFI